LSNVKRLKIAATAASLRTAYKQDNPKLLDRVRDVGLNGAKVSTRRSSSLHLSY